MTHALQKGRAALGFAIAAVLLLTALFFCAPMARATVTDPQEYTVEVTNTEGGWAVVSHETAQAGTAVTVDPVESHGYALTSLTVTAGEEQIPTEQNEEGDYVFLMPESDVTVFAAFEELPKYDLTLSYDEGKGTIYLSAGTALEGSQVYVHCIRINTGYAISSVQILTEGGEEISCEDEGDGLFSFIMPADDVHVTVSFRNLSPISIYIDSTMEGGTVTSDLSGTLESTTVTLTVTPDEGYALEELSVVTAQGVPVATVQSGNVFTFKAPNRNVDVSATFRSLHFGTVTVESAENGSVEADAEEIWEDSTVTLTVTPEEGYLLASLTVKMGEEEIPLTKTEDGYTFVMPEGDVTVTPVFALDLSADVTVNDEGAVSSSIPFHIYYEHSISQFLLFAEELALPAGSIITDLQFYAEAMEDHSLHLKIYVTQTDLTSLSRTAYAEVTEEDLVFDADVTLTEEGTVLRFSLENPFLYEGGNLAVTVIASADSYASSVDFLGKRMDSGALSHYQDGTAYQLEDLVSADVWNFVPKTTVFCILPTPFDVSVESPMENGTVEADATAYGGATVTLTVTPEEGFVLDTLTVKMGDVEIPTVKNGNVCTFTMPEGDVTVTATFRAAEQFTVAIEGGTTGGTLTADATTVLEGSTVTLTATPDEGLALHTLTVRMGEELIPVTEMGEGVYTFVMPRGNVTVSAVFGDPPDEETTVGEGTQTNGDIPFNTYFHYSVSQFVLLEEELDIPEGAILTALQFYAAESRNHSLHLKIYLTKTDLTSLSRDKYAEVTQADLVFDSEVTLTEEETVLHFALQRAYRYGGGNLAVTVVTDAESYVSSMPFRGISATGRAIGMASDLVPLGLASLGEAVFYQFLPKMTLFSRTPALGNVSVENTAENGTVGADDTAYEGATVTVTATPDEGFVLDTLTVRMGDVEIPTVKNGNVCTFVMPAGDVTVTATFRTVEQFTVTVPDGTPGGTLTADATTVNEGSTVTLTVTPEEGFILDTLTVKMGDVEIPTVKNGNVYTFTMPRGDVTVSATFKDPSQFTDVRVVLSDSFGDGWNGAYITVSVTLGGEVILIKAFTVDDDFDYEETFSVPKGAEVSFSWVEGEYDSECSYQIYLGADLIYEGQNKPRKEDFLSFVNTAAMFTGASLSLGADLTVYYYVNVLSPAILEGNTLAVRFTMNGKTVTVTDYKTVDGEYVFAFAGIAPQCMTDRIDAELVLLDGEGNVKSVLHTKEGYSVKQNALALLEQYDNESLERAVADLLAYGAAAQEYRDYKTDSLPDADLSFAPSDLLPTATDKALITHVESLGDVYFTAATLWFDSVNKIGVQLSTAQNARLLVNGEEVTLVGNTYFTEGIAPTDFGTVYTFVLYEGETQVQTLSYSVNSYAYSMQSSDNEEMKALATALYRYGVSAKAYAEIPQIVDLTVKVGEYVFVAGDFIDIREEDSPYVTIAVKIENPAALHDGCLLYHAEGREPLKILDGIAMGDDGKTAIFTFACDEFADCHDYEMQISLDGGETMLSLAFTVNYIPGEFIPV